MNNLIDITRAFVKAQLALAEGGHDWFHIERVYNNAMLIAQGEACDLLIVQLGAPLYDIQLDRMEFHFVITAFKRNVLNDIDNVDDGFFRYILRGQELPCH